LASERSPGKSIARAEISFDAGVEKHADASEPLNDAGVEADADAAEPGDAGCNTPSTINGYCTIAAAISAASPGDVIEIPAGNFAETLEIPIALTLRGAGSAAGGTSLAAVIINAPGAVLEAIHIEAQQTTGLLITADATVRDLRITGAAGTGIRVASPAIATIDAAIVEGVTADAANHGEGIAVAGGASATITASRITDNHSAGIYAEPGSTVIVRSSEASRNGTGASLYGDGVLVEGSGTIAVVESSILDDNDGYGVHCRSNAEVDPCTGNQHQNNDRGWTDCNRC
jgi:hypothetical protein